MWYSLAKMFFKSSNPHNTNNMANYFFISKFTLNLNI